MTNQDRAGNVVEGTVSPGFEAVVDAFESNFQQRGELGAAFAVTLRGDPVVDLWGGLSDRESGRPWEQGTLQVVYSGTKGLVALCLLMLVARGELDLQAPVCNYWPEFASNDKEHLRVIDLASHRAGLPGFRETVSEDELIDDRRMAALLASQPVDEDPRAESVYHALTYGWLCGEVVRRVDGRSVGRFFAEEVAEPLDLEIWIGLPANLESRVSQMSYAANWGQQPAWSPEALASDQLLARIWNNPPLFPPGRLPSNRVDWHQAEMPGISGIATALSLAKLYGCLAIGGELDGVRLLSAETLALGRSVVTSRRDALSDEPHVFGVGFQLQTEQHFFGKPDDAFGHSGAGGSVHCAWPTQGVGISYTMNLLRDDEPVDPRPQVLLNTLYGCLQQPVTLAR